MRTVNHVHCYLMMILFLFGFVSFYYYLPHYNFVKDADEPLKAVYDKSDNSYKFYLETDVNGYDVVADDAIEYRRVYKDNMEFIRYNIKVKVQSIGDSNGLSSDRIFNVKYSDIETIYEHMKNFGCFYKKNSHGNDLSYYFRIFKKLKTLNGDDLKSDVNKVGFGRNIYGDETAQIIFMDDINIENLKDHNNRPLTEVFLTIVKSNRGYQKWYANTPNFTDEDIEYSHCFGKVTSGIDFCGIDDEPFDYNVHYLHNISKSNAPTMSELNTLSAWGETILRGVPKVLEDEININKNEFYGDIVEFDTDAFTETIIGNVYHRFNTAQREIWNTNYKHIVRDEIVSDDYDNVNGVGKAFNVATYYLNNVTTSVDEKGVEKEVMFGNISPEGYFYNPHNKIKIREINDIELKSDAKHINYSEYKFRKITTTLLFKADGTIKIYNDELDAMIAKEADDTIATQGSYYEIDIKAPTNFGFLKGDYIAFYNKKTTETSWGEIVSVSGDMVTVRYDDSSFATIDNVTSQHFKPNSGQRCLYAFWSPDNVPVYAQLSLGTQKFVWKNIIPPSEMTNEDDLYDTPFANGRFYIENNINLFLKRQDPHGKYGLSLPLFKVYEQTLANPLLRFNVTGGEPIDMFDIIYQINNDLTSCV